MCLDALPRPSSRLLTAIWTYTGRAVGLLQPHFCRCRVTMPATGTRSIRICNERLWLLYPSCKCTGWTDQDAVLLFDRECTLSLAGQSLYAWRALIMCVIAHICNCRCLYRFSCPSYPGHCCHWICVHLRLDCVAMRFDVADVHALAVSSWKQLLQWITLVGRMVTSQPCSDSIEKRYGSAHSLPLEDRWLRN